MSEELRLLRELEVRIERLENAVQRQNAAAASAQRVDREPHYKLVCDVQQDLRVAGVNRPPKCPRCGRPAVKLRRYLTCVSRRPYWRVACNFCPREGVWTCEFPNEPSRPIKVKPTWLVFE